MPTTGGGPKRRRAEALRRLKQRLGTSVETLLTRILVSPLATVWIRHKNQIRESLPYVASRIIRIDKRAPSPFGAAIA
jgi:hypothetical protein